MTEPRDPYASALTALRRMTVEGRFSWGEAIVIKTLAAELRLSPTPVREALACLSGLGLIEHRRGYGYFHPSLTAADIVDLYDIEWTYVHSALTLHHRGAESLRASTTSRGPLSSKTLLACAIVEHTGNDLLAASHSAVIERLTAAERTRATIESHGGATIDAITAAIASDSRDGLLHLLECDHRHRVSYASEIARTLRREASRRI